VLVLALHAEASWRLSDLAPTTFVVAGLIKIVASATLVAGAWGVRHRPRVGQWWAVLLGAALIVVVSAAATSHGVARLARRATSMALDAFHQLAASAWIGGLVHLSVAVFGGRAEVPTALVRRFSTLALASVATLITAGVGLTLVYVDGVQGMLGTAY